MRLTVPFRSATLALLAALVTILGVAPSPASATDFVLRGLTTAYLPDAGRYYPEEAWTQGWPGDPRSIAFDGTTLYVFDAYVAVPPIGLIKPTLYKVGPDGIPHTIDQGSELSGVWDIAVGPSGDLYATDLDKKRVLKYAGGKGPRIVVAGGNGVGNPTPGPATASKFSDPRGIAIDASGNVLVADSGAHQVVKITPTGTLSVLAGTGTIDDTVPHAGAATATPVYSPTSVAVDPSGNTWIGGSRSNYLAKVNPGGTLSVLLATASRIEPLDLAADTAGNIIIGTSVSVQKYVPSTGALSIIAGTGIAGPGSSGDHVPTEVTIAGLRSVATDPVLGYVFLSTNGSRHGIYMMRQFPPGVAKIELGDLVPDTNDSTLKFTVTFNEPVAGVDASDFTVHTTGTATGTVSSLVADTPGLLAKTFFVTTSVSGEGAVRLDLKGSGTDITDLFGHPEATTDPFGHFVKTGYTGGPSYALDQTPPVVQSVTPKDPVNGGASTVHYRVTFSESPGPNGPPSVHDFALTTTGSVTGQITGVKSAPLSWGPTWDVTISSITGDGTLRLDVKTGGDFMDLAFNPLARGFTSAPVYNYDQAAPHVVSVTPKGTLVRNGYDGKAFEWTVVFDKPVTATPFDFNPVGVRDVGEDVTVTGSGTSTITVAFEYADGDGLFRLKVNTSGGVKSLRGVALADEFTSPTGFTVDVTGPKMLSAVPVEPITPSNATTRSFTVTFNEPVTEVEKDTFSALTTGTVKAAVASVTGQGATYTVTFGAITGTGTLGLGFDGEPAYDHVGNFGNPAAGTVFFSIDHEAPVATIAPIGTLAAGATAGDFAVTFSEPVTGVDAGDFTTATTGSATGAVTGVAGGGTSYTVSVGGIAGSGTLGLALSGGGIVDLAGNPLTAATSATGFTVTPGTGDGLGGAGGGGGAGAGGGSGVAGGAGGGSGAAGGAGGGLLSTPIVLAAPCTSRLTFVSGGAVKGAAALALTWPGTPATTCSAKFALTVKKSKKAKKPTAVGGATLTIGKAQNENLTLKLNAAGKKLLATKKKLTATLTVTIAGKVTTTQAITIKPAKAPKKK